MGVYIRGMGMPTSCNACMFDVYGLCLIKKNIEGKDELTHSCPLVSVPPHGRLIDADALRKRMYNDAFETDSDMQKWDSGCWIRFKMFENAIDDAPTVDAVPVVRCSHCCFWDPLNISVTGEEITLFGICTYNNRNFKTDPWGFCYEGDEKGDNNVSSCIDRDHS